GPCAGARGEADRGNIRHLAIATARFVWTAVLLPAAERLVLDVRYKSAQSALHAIICLSSTGVASRSERCAAHLLWVRGDCGCVYSQIKSRKNRYRGHLEGGIFSGG